MQLQLESYNVESNDSLTITWINKRKHNVIKLNQQYQSILLSGSDIRLDWETGTGVTRTNGFILSFKGGYSILTPVYVNLFFFV